MEAKIEFLDAHKVQEELAAIREYQEVLAKQHMLVASTMQSAFEDAKERHLEVCHFAIPITKLGGIHLKKEIREALKSAGWHCSYEVYGSFYDISSQSGNSETKKCPS